MSSKKKYFYLIESKDNFYCVAEKDLNVSSATVREGDELGFKYGSKSYEGTVMAPKGTEKDILDQIKHLKKTKKPWKRSSFHEDQPRNAAVQQRQMMEALKGNAKGPKITSKSTTKEVKKEMELKRTTAERATEDAITDTAPQHPKCDSEVLQSTQEVNSLKGSSVSLPDSSIATDSSVADDNSSVIDDASSKRRGKAQDIQALRRLMDQSSSDSNNAENALNKETVGEEQDSSNASSDKTVSESPSITSEIKMQNGKAKTLEKNKMVVTANEDKDGGKSKDTKRILTDDEENMEGVKDKSDSKKKRVDNERKEVGKNKTESEEKSKKQGVTDEIKNTGMVKSDQSMKKVKDQGHDQDRNVKTVESNKNEEEGVTDLDAERAKKRDKKKRKKSKKSKKHRKRSSSSESTDSSASDSESSDSKSQNRKRRKRSVVRRNYNIYDGVNFKYSETDRKVVKLHEDYNVFVKEKDLEEASNSKSVTQFIRRIVDKVYTQEALVNATPQGFPPRGKGKKHYKKNSVPPRLHPDGMNAIIDKAKAMEAANKKWRPKQSDQYMKSVFSTRCCEVKNSATVSESSDTST